MEKKKIALITGASAGIGKEFAHIHAARGGDLVIVARREDKLLALKEEVEKNYAVKVNLLVKDLSDPKAPKEIYEEVLQQGIQIDYLINNAGFGGIGKFYERDLAKELNMINLNISALTSLTHFFLQDFVKKNSGRILNVSSTASLLPGPLQAVYYATKAYVTSFSNALAEELRDTDISVTNLMPGATATEFGSISGMDKTALFDKTASARKVAEDGYNGMLKEKLDVISGLTTSQKIVMSMVPLTPKKVLLSQVRKMQAVKGQ
ncbi:MAG: SDR family NAD(P)-dependent oxidoreductase [Fulvivirga sp.]